MATTLSATEIWATAKLPPTAAEGLSAAGGLADAEAFTRRLAESHYENFSVVTKLLPARLRQPFCNIYAFCRIADDLGDETGDRSASLRYLSALRDELARCYDGSADTKLFVALGHTAKQFDIPIDPFADLISAFEQDQTVTRYSDMAPLLDYCRRSANPVGRLVLCLCGRADARRRELSDNICTALQLANFWQDVRRDILERDRIYIPRDYMARHGVTEAQILDGKCTPGYRDMMRELVAYTREMFDAGEPLLPMLDAAYRPQIALFGKGGRAVLDAIARRNFDTLTGRPKIGRFKKVSLMLGVLARTSFARGSR